MPIKAIFFDIDNTLYDSATLAAMARRNSVLAMIDAGLDHSEEKILKDLKDIIDRFGPNYHRHYDELLGQYGRVDPKIIAAGVVAYEHTKIGYLKPFAGVVPALIELQKHYRLGVISNGLTIKQWEKLVGLGLHHFFEAVVTSQACDCEKPEVEIFESALRVLGVKPGEAVMIGDKAETDIEGARNAGIHAFRFTRNPSKGINEISNFSEIIDRVKEL